MTAWNKAPLIRPLISFITGILLALTIPYFCNNTYIFVFISVFIILILQLYFSYKYEWLLGLIINITLVLLGYQLTITHNEKLSPEHFLNFKSNSEYAYVHITQAPVKKDKSIKVIAEVRAIKRDNKWQPTKGKILLYLQKDEQSNTICYGDNLITKTHFTELQPPHNPHQFNYKKYLSYRNIYHQAFLKSEMWSLANKNTGSPLHTITLELRNKLLKIMSDYNIKNNEFAVGSALLLGYEDELNQELFSAYSSSGVIHILSVSGLHVGIVYFVFNWIFFFFEKIKKGNVIKAILLMFILWFYAGITGLSPSVLRATAMFTFIIIAQAFNRNNNIYNTLAASAFFLLLINPFIIMDVGFQLSYLAVIGIVTLYPLIYPTFEFGNKLIDMIWKMTAVSIAAQIATFPLCLFYFHQFPNYFLLANLIAIPLSTLIIYLGISLLLLFKIPLIANVLAYLFSFCISTLNNVIVKFENLPHASLSGIYITVFEMLIIYGIIGLFCCYFIKPKVKLLIALFSSAILLLSIQIVEQYKQSHQKKLIVYSISNSCTIDFISGKNNVLFTDSIDNKTISFQIKNNWDNLSIDSTRSTNGNITTSHLMIQENYIQFYNKRIVVLKNRNKNSDTTEMPLNIDYLILSGTCKLQMQEILKMFNPTLIVFDSSNNKYQLDKRKRECIENNKAFYSVINSGAWVVDI